MSDALLTCPKCGQPLIFLWSDHEWQFYRCPLHRTIAIPSPPPPEGDDAHEQPRER